MSVPSQDPIQQLLDKLMTNLRSDGRLAAEVARAEREFFAANPSAREGDPTAMVRFREWYLLERESEQLGGVPCEIVAMTDAERESLRDSVVGVFQVTGRNGDEYVVVDLQEGETYDVLVADDTNAFASTDVLVGRLFDGPLDVYVPSAALACQRGARELAAAFTKDIENLALERRLTQAEIEHLLFRGRGQADAEIPATANPAALASAGPAPEAIPETPPLEHLEADLERCLSAGGVSSEELSATSISTALADSPRPGIIIGPLLEKIAFDTTADLQELQQLMVQIWQHHHGSESATAALQPPRAEPPASESAPDESGAADEPAGLGQAIRERLEAGMAGGEDLERLFDEVDDMVGVTSEDGEPTVDAAGQGDLRPLLTEYLWERGEDAAPDREPLEHIAVTLAHADPPRVDLADVTIADVLRILVDRFVQAAPGGRTGAVGEAFATMQRFSAWADETQGVGWGEALASAQDGFVDHVARLETVSLALSEAGETGGEVLRVESVSEGGFVVKVRHRDEPIQVDAPPTACQNIQIGDLLIGVLDGAGPGRGTFAGNVLALPAIASELIG